MYITTSEHGPGQIGRKHSFREQNSDFFAVRFKYSGKVVLVSLQSCLKHFQQPTILMTLALFPEIKANQILRTKQMNTLYKIYCASKNTIRQGINCSKDCTCDK